GPHGQQLVQGAGGVAVVGAAAGVVGGQQHLADPAPVARERGRVAGHQQALADAGGGLLAGQVARAPLEPQRRQARGDGTGGDQDYLLAPRVAGTAWAAWTAGTAWAV